MKINSVQKVIDILRFKDKAFWDKQKMSFYKRFSSAKYRACKYLQVCMAPESHTKTILNMPKNSICIDCGSHAGDITEVFRQLGAYVYAFEPNADLINKQKERFKGVSNVELINKAVWDKYTTLELKALKQNGNLNLGGSSILKIDDSDELKQEGLISNSVEVIDLIDFMEKNIFARGKTVQILKLDVEGAEYEIIEKLLTSGAYKKIAHIFVETHARFFKDGAEKMKKIHKMIEDYKAENIYLDWT